MNKQIPSSMISLNKRTQVNADEVTLLEGDSNYTTIHFKKGNPLVIALTLKKIEPLLKDYDFLRIHKKFVLNLNYADDSLLNKDAIILQNSIEIKVSRRKRVALKKKLILSKAILH